MESLSSTVHRDPDILGGKTVFRGTRVPLRNLIDYLESNHSVNEFLADFPSVHRAQVMAVLEAIEGSVERARPAG